jgi:hypothetical protein
LIDTIDAGIGGALFADDFFVGDSFLAIFCRLTDDIPTYICLPDSTIGKSDYSSAPRARIPFNANGNMPSGQPVTPGREMFDGGRSRAEC